MSLPYFQKKWSIPLRGALLVSLLVLSPFCQLLKAGSSHAGEKISLTEILIHV